jgi:PKD repeat protein
LTFGGFMVPVLPYEIPYRCLVPQRVSNLLVTVCCSATHVAYCTVRMEPVYMMLGHAAGVAAHLARTGTGAASEVDVARLQGLLREQGQVLDAPYWPVADFTATPAPDDPRTFTFTAAPKVARAPIVRWWWDFDGDGGGDATEETVTHTFPADGTYGVGLLLADEKGQRSEAAYRPVTVGAGGPADVVVDDYQATCAGHWMASASVPGAVGLSYRHDRNVNKGMQQARFRPNLPTAGRWLVCVSYAPHSNRASNVPYTIFHRGGETVVTLDQRTKDTPFPFVPLGEFEFAAGTDGSVLVDTGGTDGYVVVDAAKWVWRGE